MEPGPTPIRVLEQFTVSPPPGSVPEDSTLPLSFFDVGWVYSDPGERIFFYSYPHPTSHFLAQSVPALRSSLSLALQRFYPFAGRIRPSPAASGLDSAFVCSYSDGDSISFLVAECTADDFDQLASGAPRNFSRMHLLVPRLPRTDDGSIVVIAVQATIFPDRGVCIGFASHHGACDDSSFTHFVRSWAAACRLGGFDSPGAPPPPCFERSTIPDLNNLCSRILAEMRDLIGNAPPPPATDVKKRPPTVIASFILKRGQLNQLKQQLLAKAAVEGGEPVHASAFVVACAFVWVCLLKVQGEEQALQKKHSYFMFTADCRSRLKPPMPAEFFGNCLKPCVAQVDTADVFKDDGVLVAAMAIGRTVKELELDDVLEGVEGWMKKVMSMIPERPVAVSGSPKIPVYDTDFGWGRPVKVETMSIEKNGAVALASSPEGDGGIEIGVVLPQAALDAFTSCFAAALKRI